MVSACQVCDGPRPREGQALGQWSCPQCTLDNAASSAACAVCGYRRAGQAGSRRAHAVPQAESSDKAVMLRQWAAASANASKNGRGSKAAASKLGALAEMRLQDTPGALQRWQLPAQKASSSEDDDGALPPEVLVPGKMQKKSSRVESSEEFDDSGADDTDSDRPRHRLSNRENRQAAKERSQQSAFDRAVQRMRGACQGLTQELVAKFANPKRGETGRKVVRRLISSGRTSITDNIAEDLDLPEAQQPESYKRLKGYQRVGVRWLKFLCDAGYGAVLADEMGLGKTAQVLTFLDLQRQLNPKMAPTLVIAPVSLLHNWENEVRKWTKLTVFRYHSSIQKERVELGDAFFELEEMPHIVLSTSNIVCNKEDRHFFFSRVKFSYFVTDEAHFLKTQTTCRVKAMHKIHAEQRILLTGTPIQNNLPELCNLLWFAMPRHFEVLTQIDRKSGSRQERSVTLKWVQNLSSVFLLRRLKSDVLRDLPQKEVIVLKCQLSAEQRRLYDQEVTAFRQLGSGGSSGSGSKKAAPKPTSSAFKNVYVRLRRLCGAPMMCQGKFSHEQYEYITSSLLKRAPEYQRATFAKLFAEVRTWSDFDVHRAAVQYGLPEPYRASNEELCSGGKFEKLVEILNARRDDKTVVFSQYTQYLDVMESVLTFHRFNYIRLDGSTDADTRQRLCDAFADPQSGVQVFILSTKAGGLGLNLVSSNMCVLMDMDYNPQNNRQAEDRVHRIGQVRDVKVVYMLTRDTIEDSILAVNLRKMKLDQAFGGTNALHDAVEGAMGAEAAPEAEAQDDAGFDKEAMQDLRQALLVGEAAEPVEGLVRVADTI